MKAEDESPLAAVAPLLVFLAVGFRMAFSSGAAGFLHEALADLMAFLAVAVALASLLRPGARSLRVNLAAGALLLFGLVFLLSGRASYYPRPGLLPVMNTAAMGCLFLVASGLVFRRGGAGSAAVFLVGLVVMTAAAGVYQYWELPRMLAKLRTETPPFRIGHVLIDEKNFADFLTRVESREIFSTFLSSNVYAGFLALSLPITLGLALGLARGASSRRFKVISAAFLAALAALEAVLLVLTKSKGGLAAAAAGVVIFAGIALYRLGSRRAFIVAVCVAAVVAAGAGFLAAPRLGQFADEARTSLDVRLGYWRATARVIKENFLEGVGPGNFETFYFQEKEVGEREVRNPHNAVLMVFAEGGLFSLVFFAGFWVLVFVGPREEPSRRTGATPVAAAAALPAAVLLEMGLVHMRGGLTAEFDLYPMLALLGGSLVGAVVVAACFLRALAADERLVRAGLAAGLCAFLMSCMVDVTFSDPGAATAAIFAAAALAPRGKAGDLVPGTARTFAVAALVIVGLVAYVGWVFLPFTQSETALEAARYDLAAGDIDRARRNAEAALEVDPGNADVLTLMGNIHEAEIRPGRSTAAAFSKAERYYNAALSTDCWHRGALEGLFRMYTGAGGDYITDAAAVVDRLLSAYPTSSRYHLMAARLYERVGLERDALSHYRTALYIDDRTEQHGIELSDEERKEIVRALARLSAAAGA